MAFLLGASMRQIIAKLWLRWPTGPTLWFDLVLYINNSSDSFFTFVCILLWFYSAWTEISNW